MYTSSSADFFHYGKVQRHSGRDLPYGISFSVLQFLRKYFKIVPETEKLKNWKTKKLKNWIFQGHSGRDSPYGFSFSVFQFFSFLVFQFFSFRNCFEIFPQKLKNWKTEFSKDIQAEILHMDSVFQFFS